MKDKERILLKLQKMNQYLDELGSMLPSTEEDYLDDLKVRRACEKTIEAAIEEVIDILSLLVSCFKLGVPTSEDNIIQIIEKKTTMNPTLLAKIKEMKGFRNILVHKYGEIDDERVYAFLIAEQDDFTLFEKEVKAYLKKKK